MSNFRQAASLSEPGDVLQDEEDFQWIGSSLVYCLPPSPPSIQWHSKADACREDQHITEECLPVVNGAIGINYHFQPRHWFAEDVTGTDGEYKLVINRTGGRKYHEPPKINGELPSETQLPTKGWLVTRDGIIITKFRRVAVYHKNFTYEPLTILLKDGPRDRDANASWDPSGHPSSRERLGELIRDTLALHRSAPSKARKSQSHGRSWDQTFAHNEADSNKLSTTTRNSHGTVTQSHRRASLTSGRVTTGSSLMPSSDHFGRERRPERAGSQEASSYTSSSVSSRRTWTTSESSSVSPTKSGPYPPLLPGSESPGSSTSTFIYHNGHSPTHPHYGQQSYIYPQSSYSVHQVPQSYGRYPYTTQTPSPYLAHNTPGGQHHYTALMPSSSTSFSHTNQPPFRPDLVHPDDEYGLPETNTIVDRGDYRYVQ